MSKKKIIIVCHDDKCLSVMIKAMLTQALHKVGLAEHFNVASAGLTSREEDLGVSATDHAIAVMDKENLDIHGHHAYFVGNLAHSLQSYHRVFTTNQEELRILLAQHNAPKDRTILLFEGTGGIHLSSSSDTHSYAQCIAQLKPEIARIASLWADELLIPQT